LRLRPIGLALRATLTRRASPLAVAPASPRWERAAFQFVYTFDNASARAK